MAGIGAVIERLRLVYGPRPRPQRGDALGELIGTILSQSTTDTNSGRAYAALRAAFPSWQAVIDAPTEAVYAAIRQAGLGNIKAPRIQATLRAVQARTGGFDLDFLADLPLAEAQRWLTSLAGVGPKTAACVLMFALSMPALPVDTHVHRVSRRLGLIGPTVGAAQAHTLLAAIVPAPDVYDFHIDMIQHGRRVCHAQRPECSLCPLADLCPRAGL